MRILVTGHRGYIGSVMVPMLVGVGHEVVGVDSDLFRAALPRPTLSKYLSWSWIFGTSSSDTWRASRQSSTLRRSQRIH